jgi:autotransporter-associated beta strand protein
MPTSLQAGVPLTGANAVTNAVQFSMTNAATLPANYSFSGTNDLELSGPISLGFTGTGLSPAITNSNTGATILSGPISGTGFGLTLWGNGRLTLGGNNTYDGATAVNGGTLLVNGSLAAASAVTVNSGGTLGGVGVIGGSAVVNSGALLSPGASVGALAIGGNLTLSGNLLIELNKSLSPSNDAVTVTGTLTNAGTGTVTVQNPGGIGLAAGDRFQIFNKPVLNGQALHVVSSGNEV